MNRNCKQIRKEFIAFFEARGHTFVPSASLLPTEDPTLLFTNAGMNQFKDVFLGREQRDYVRAANSQKCIRAGGKHNDLEDVGHDVYHHTFFEMLGNWSFGDYFKREAIQWAWQLLTDVWGLAKDRLHVTVFEGDPADGLEPDTEAEQIWKELTDIDSSQIHRGGKKDNFWEMGQIGPCGPCSEMHIDLTEDRCGAKLVNAGDPRVIEIWNLVFIQYNRDEGGKLSPLPARHVDTGMGLERIAMVLQGKKSNYATDLFVPVIEKIETLTDHRYGASAGLEDRFDVTSEDDIGDVACRVIADHARALTFAIADGVVPSNEGRGYVLRRILRRAARYGRQYLHIKAPFLVKLVPVVVELMGDVFSKLRQRQETIIKTIREEEESFGKTLDRGIELFQRQAEELRKAGKRELSGDDAFELYATYGFPVDLTQIMAAEVGLTVDMAGYDSAMARHRELSGSGHKFQAAEIADLPATDDSAKYVREPIGAKVIGWVIDGKFIDTGSLNTGDEAAVVLDRTNFYGEAGGQVGDAGVLSFNGGRFAVREAAIAKACVLHIGVLESGGLAVGQTVAVAVDSSRIETMRNHTATHLLNWALREVLGEHINQAGSVVAPDRLRFDFTHSQAVTPEQLQQVERLVNERILADEAVSDKTLPLAEAKKIPGVRAVFGEKYPDPVRVIAIGSDTDTAGLADANDRCAIEFCGGTHLSRTSPVGLFKIISEESVAKGIRRVTAITGRSAVAYVQQLDKTVRAATAALGVPADKLPDRIAAIQKEIRQSRKQPAAGSEAFQPDFVIETPAGKVLIGQTNVADAAAMRKLCDEHRQKGAAAMLVGAAEGQKVTLVAMVTEQLIAQCKLVAGEWVKAVAAVVGGSGGGKPTMAQAGGKQPEKLPDALQVACDWARARVT